MQQQVSVPGQHQSKRVSSWATRRIPEGGPLSHILGNPFMRPQAKHPFFYYKIRASILATLVVRLLQSPFQFNLSILHFPIQLLLPPLSTYSSCHNDGKYHSCSY